jgi:hypothetical protein
MDMGSPWNTFAEACKALTDGDTGSARQLEAKLIHITPEQILKHQRHPP